VEPANERAVVTGGASVTGGGADATDVAEATTGADGGGGAATEDAAAAAEADDSPTDALEAEVAAAAEAEADADPGAVCFDHGATRATPPRLSIAIAPTATVTVAKIAKTSRVRRLRRCTSRSWRATERSILSAVLIAWSGTLRAAFASAFGASEGLPWLARSTAAANSVID